MNEERFEQADELLPILQKLVEEELPYRKWTKEIHLWWDDTFSITFFYTEDFTPFKEEGEVEEELYILRHDFSYSSEKPKELIYRFGKSTFEGYQKIKEKKIEVN